MTKADTSQDKKTQILSAATILLARQGLQAFSYEALAHEAGLSRQLIRYYYDDPDDLIADLCDHLGNAYRQTLVAGVVDIGQVERLGFFMDFFFDLAEGYPMPDKLEVYDAMMAYAGGSEQVKGRMRGQYQTLGQVMVHELAIAHPALTGEACEELSFLFVSMMHAHWSFVASLGYSRDHGRLARKAMDRLIASYVAETQFTPCMDKPWALDG
ncbi:TetR/AcrR family transcriptional regulator [uncultured Tateyamaria sp.]|uniref:TetR/AcrR family transcriptional regulator n=1 Tax=uncultured Tateyamaria sp. TaxID=455651 RepID=UPI0026189AEA|nr:TetR/AcrR family transcriptional regulator [uncultured Tateyamaria sp.]